MINDLSFIFIFFKIRKVGKSEALPQPTDPNLKLNSSEKHGSLVDAYTTAYSIT
jgi:hypothetical protein